MASIKDNKGYNQGFKPSKALEVRTERRCDYIISQMDPGKMRNILEIGCGTGELAYLIAKKTGKNVCGIDICKKFVDAAKKKYILNNLKFKTADFNNFKLFKKQKFDYIVGNGILHHLYYKIDDTLKAMQKMLQKNGKIIFLEPNIYNPYCMLIFKILFLRKAARLDPVVALTKE